MKLKKSNWPLIFLFCLLPIIVMCMLSCWTGFDVSKFTPVYDDEVCWYNQVEAVVKYGKPLGYFGYNGSHAPIGTFGPWGMSVIYFMSLIPKLLSVFAEMNESMLILGNLGWACLANGLFVLLAKPNRAQLKCLILLYLCLFVNHLYMFVAMAEILRFSMGVILAGMICYLHNCRDHSNYRIMLYAVVPISILLAASAYVVFGVLFPIWFYFIYKHNENRFSRYSVQYFAATFLFSVCLTFAIFLVNAKFVSPYIGGVIPDIKYAFEKGIEHGIKFTILSILQRLKNYCIGYVISSAGLDDSFVFIQLLLYYFTLIYLLVYSIMKGRKNSFKDNEVHFIAAFILLGWLGSFVILYEASNWTLLRGLNVSFVILTYFLAMTDMRVLKRIIAIALLGVVPFTMQLTKEFIPERNNINRENFSEEFRQYIVINEKSKDPWENTVALYGREEKCGVDLPCGAGVNYMLWGINERAKYVVVEGDGWIKNERIHEQLVENNHEIVFEKETVIILKNKSFD